MEIQKELLELKADFEKLGQGHVFQYVSELEPSQLIDFLKQASSVHLEELEELIQQHVFKEEPVSEMDFDMLKPADFIPVPENGGDQALWDQAEIIGTQAIREGRVAAFTVAGGQGTRLGFDGPKGTFPVMPLSKKSLFEVFADKIARASERFEVDIPWFIMTSELNHKATMEAFEAQAFFGLKRDSIHFFPQELIPAVDIEGKIILEEKGVIAMSPNGHGGALRALLKSGATEIMREAGIDILSYFQVDNPMVACIDPSFIGFHIMNEADLSSKRVGKTYASEKVGLFCNYEGSDVVLEYSDLPTMIQEMQDPAGDLLYSSGNIAVHLFDRGLIERLGSETSREKLAFHKAFKKIPYFDAQMGRVNPSENNGYKFEMFVFDELPKAKKSLIVEGLREDTFSPVKNAEGVDSPQSSKESLQRQAQRWLSAAFTELQIGASNLNNCHFEINFRFAMDAKDFVQQWKKLEIKPEIQEGLIIGNTINGYR